LGERLGIFFDARITPTKGMHMVAKTKWNDAGFLIMR
jgi:hypothetical protein